MIAASMSRDEALPGKESSSFVLEKESLSVTLLVHPDYTAISYLPVFAKDLPQHAISCPDSPCLQASVPYSADFHQRRNEFSAGPCVGLRTQRSGSAGLHIWDVQRTWPKAL